MLNELVIGSGKMKRAHEGEEVEDEVELEETEIGEEEVPTDC